MSERKQKSGATPSPALAYLDLIARRMQAIRRDMTKLTAMGERMTEPLLKGGDLFLGGVGRFWGSEFIYRAGGMMGLRYNARLAKRGDVVYFELPSPEHRSKQDESLLRKLVKGPAHLFVVGAPEHAEGLAPARRFGGFTDCPADAKGSYPLAPFGPLVSTDLFERLVRGWIVGGETIAAFTRGGQMPIIWMSVWFEGAVERNNAFLYPKARRDGTRCDLFHSKLVRENTTLYIPPLAPGYAGNAFMAGLERIHSSLVSQAPVLSRAGRMLAQAKHSGHRISASAAGHCYPHALSLPEKAEYPIHWLPPIASLTNAVPAEWQVGDAALHFGYGPTDPREVRALLKRGIRLIHTSPYGRPATLPRHEHHVWFDLPWQPGDAEVLVPGYSVRILPASSSADTMAYFCLLSELAGA